MSGVCMIRLILVIVIFAFFLVFIGFNLPHKCDISFGFKTYKDVPVFLSALFSFVLGMIFTVPLVFSIGRGRKKAAPPSVKEPKKRWGKKDKAPQLPQGTETVKDGPSSGTFEVKKEDSPYGID